MPAEGRTSEDRRVVVTGMGVVCSLGASLDEFWRNCLESRARVEHIPESWKKYHRLSSTIWSTLPEVDLKRHGVTRVDALRLDTATQLAIACSSMALGDAGIEQEVLGRNALRLKGIDPARTGVLYGTGAAGVTSFFSSHANHLLLKPKTALAALLQAAAAREPSRAFLDELAAICAEIEVPNRYNPFVVSMGMPNAVSANISLRFGITGPSTTVCAACASGTVALGHAYRCVKAAVMDVAVTGGAEYLRDESGSIFRGFDVAGTLAKEDEDRHRSCRPFDRKHNGFLFSEGGAATLILEELGHAMARGAPICGEVVGYAETCDAANIMCIDGNSEHVRRAIVDAIAEAGLSPADIDYINAHGTGTVVNDDAEAAVIDAIFGKRPFVNSTKSILGHTVGASGAIEAIVTLLSIKNQVTHVCNNLKDPIVDLNFVTDVMQREIHSAVSQSFAFGGHNAVLVFREFQGL